MSFKALSTRSPALMAAQKREIALPGSFSTNCNNQIIQIHNHLTKTNIENQLIKNHF
jgi:hypothetical protein